jgi:hypothetical protein
MTRVFASGEIVEYYGYYAIVVALAGRLWWVNKRIDRERRREELLRRNASADQERSRID